MVKLSRRTFLRLLSAGAGGVAFAAVLSRCAPDAKSTTPAVVDNPATDGIATATPATASPGRPQRLRSENRPGFYIRYINTFEPLDVAQWRLTVKGLVEYPQELSFADILKLPAVEQASRLKCVEGWSAAARWSGFRPQQLVDLVKPYSNAAWVHFHCADGYYESIELNELLAERVLLVYGMNGEHLAPEYGAPLRLIVPSKYGYKGPKAITRITFAEQELRGFWPTMGSYTTDGHIQPGTDYAIDLDTYDIFDKMGEIRYEEGIESQGNGS